MIIGLVGLKQSGKSTAVEIIKSIFDAEEIQLAKHLKDVCSEVFMIPRDHFDDQNYKEVPFRPYCISLKHLIKILDKFDLLTEDNLSRVKKHVGVSLNTPRYTAQYVGTDILRDLDENIHVKIAIKNADKNKIGVVSDIRFHNEFDIFEKTGHFKPIFIFRSSVVPKDLESQHPSEKDILKVGERCGIKIYNNGSLEDFRRLVSMSVDVQQK